MKSGEWSQWSIIWDYYWTIQAVMKRDVDAAKHQDNTGQKRVDNRRNRRSSNVSLRKH